MMPVAFIAHSVGGRTRFRLPHDAAGERAIVRAAQELPRLEGVESLAVNRLTGSIVVKHRGPLAEVIAWAREHGLFETAITSHSRTGQTAIAPHDGSDSRNLGALTLISLGLLQMARGDVLPAALPLLMQGASLWRLSPKPEPLSSD